MNELIAVLLALSLSASALSAHEHHAPHGGTLVVLGGEFAHLELVLDPKTGTLTGYILDGEAENPVRIEQQDIEIRIKDTNSQGGGAGKISLKLKAVPNVLTGETAGDTSEFAVQSDTLKSVETFDGVISAISIKGREFKEVDFRFPEGNELNE